MAPAPEWPGDGPGLRLTPYWKPNSIAPTSVICHCWKRPWTIETTPKTLANWFVNIEIPSRRNNELAAVADDALRSIAHREVYELLQANKLSSNTARSLLLDLLNEAALPANAEAYAEARGYIQNSDEGAILAIVDLVLADNSQAAEDVKNGEMKAIGFLVGQIMKASQGKANPQLAQQLIKRQLKL